jgi:hypothetical protein
MTWGVAKSKTLSPCLWDYASKECGVSIPMAFVYRSCDKTIEACRERRNEHRFNGYFVETEEKEKPKCQVIKGKAMKLSEVEKYIEDLHKKFGDVPLVLYDLDTSMYFTLTPKNFEAQQMKDGSIRISVGPNSYGDPKEPEPKKRPVDNQGHITFDISVPMISGWNINPSFGMSEKENEE